MIELQGKYSKAKVFNDMIEETAISQILELTNQPFAEESDIRIMPDVHAGAGCVIGTTMKITDKVVPSLVGVDIGCGMETVSLNVKKEDIDFDKLDKVINSGIPHGSQTRGVGKGGTGLPIHRYAHVIELSQLKAEISMSKAENSMGSLGGGNHFIELNEDSAGFVYLVIHSGSRYVGAKVAKQYIDLAHKRVNDVKPLQDEIIKELKAQGRQREIESELKKIRKPKVKKDLAYLEGQDMEDYLHDMRIVQHYAKLNRKAIAREIIEMMGWEIVDSFTTIHNYIDLDNMIMRKGAISAEKGEVVLIPINMRDGSIIGVGKGNPDWNFSGPHGAGRLMSRTKAKEMIDFELYKHSMKDIWTSSVVESTIDEAPMAYKSIDDIIDNVQDSVEIVDVIKPIYNFKAK